MWRPYIATSEQSLEGYPSIEVPTTACPTLRLIRDMIRSCMTDKGISRSDARWWSFYYLKTDLSQSMQAGKGVRLCEKVGTKSEKQTEKASEFACRAPQFHVLS